MNKVLNLLKRCIVFCFAIFFTITSFAGVVNNSDGNAFLTKGAFEEMKTEFDDKITNYNNSLDNKIDGAVAAYLAGLTIEDDEIKQNLGIYRVPLNIYMNFDDVDTSGFSSWRPSQSWKVFIGYYSAYITQEVKINAPTDSSGNTWQPKQWYNLSKDEKGSLYCDSGYKTIKDTLSYVIWGLSDTGLGTGSGASSAKSTHAYLFASNLSTVDSSAHYSPTKQDYTATPLCVKTGEYKWDTSQSKAPNVYGVTTVRDDTAGNCYLSYNTSTKKLSMTGASWFSGFHSVLHSTQASTQENSYVDAITNNSEDYVHALYDNKVIYSVRDDSLYGIGSLGSRREDGRAALDEIRTSSRNVYYGDRYIWAFAVPNFAIIKEGWNTATTVINYDSDHFENTSLIKANHVSQKYKGKGEQGTDLTLKISDGIYLCTPDKKGDIKLTLEVDTTDLDAGDRPYIIFNTKAIDKTSLSGNLQNEGFKKIEGGTKISDTYGDYAKYIVNGKNTLTIKECEKGKPIVMKILWGTSSKKKVILKSAVSMSLSTENY